MTNIEERWFLVSYLARFFPDRDFDLPGEGEYEEQDQDDEDDEDEDEEEEAGTEKSNRHVPARFGQRSRTVT